MEDQTQEVAAAQKKIQDGAYLDEKGDSNEDDKIPVGSKSQDTVNSVAKEAKELTTGK